MDTRVAMCETRRYATPMGSTVGRIVSDPEILDGKPCVKGTRLSVGVPAPNSPRAARRRPIFWLLIRNSPKRERSPADRERRHHWVAGSSPFVAHAILFAVWIALNVGLHAGRRALRPLSLQLPDAGRLARSDLPGHLRPHVAEPGRTPRRSPRPPRSAGRPARRARADGDAAHAARALRQAQGRARQVGTDVNDLLEETNVAALASNLDKKLPA